MEPDGSDSCQWQNLPTTIASKLVSGWHLLRRCMAESVDLRCIGMRREVVLGPKCIARGQGESKNCALTAIDSAESVEEPLVRMSAKVLLTYSWQVGEGSAHKSSREIPCKSPLSTKHLLMALKRPNQLPSREDSMHKSTLYEAPIMKPKS